MANKKITSKKTAAPKVAKKVTQKVAVQKKSILHQEVTNKNAFLLLVLVAFIVITVTLISFNK